MKLLGICCAIAATGTVLVYGFGLQVQRPIAPLEATQKAPRTTPKAPEVAATGPVHAPEHTPEPVVSVAAAEPAPAAVPTLESEQAVITEDPVSTTKQASLSQQINAATEITVPVEPAIVEQPEATTDQVFVFWQPFLSRGSAQGFAQGLSARAEVPISVISEDTESGRHYRVVLPYDNEAQRLERLAKLESTTRLEMGE